MAVVIISIAGGNAQMAEYFSQQKPLFILWLYRKIKPPCS
jgi:hypothetical protein